MSPSPFVLPSDPGFCAPDGDPAAAVDVGPFAVDLSPLASAGEPSESFWIVPDPAFVDVGLLCAGDSLVGMPWTLCVCAGGGDLWRPLMAALFISADPVLMSLPLLGEYALLELFRYDDPEM